MDVNHVLSLCSMGTVGIRCRFNGEIFKQKLQNCLRIMCCRKVSNKNSDAFQNSSSAFLAWQYIKFTSPCQKEFKTVSIELFQNISNSCNQMSSETVLEINFRNVLELYVPKHCLIQRSDNFQSCSCAISCMVQGQFNCSVIMHI